MRKITAFFQPKPDATLLANGVILPQHASQPSGPVEPPSSSNSGANRLPVAHHQSDRVEKIQVVKRVIKIDPQGCCGGACEFGCRISFPVVEQVARGSICSFCRHPKGNHATLVNTTQHVSINSAYFPASSPHGNLKFIITSLSADVSQVQIK